MVVLSRRLVLALLVGFVTLAASDVPRAVSAPVAAPPARLTDAEFWRLASGFSEPDGTFHSENLVSNEAQFQSIVPSLIATTAPGRAYVGVGSEQNYTYIAAVRPAMAFIVDIRRGNFDLHLTYKALFELSANRAEFVSRLFSRPRPPGLGPSSTPTEIFDALSRARRRASPSLYDQNLRAILAHLTKTHGFALPMAIEPESTTSIRPGSRRSRHLLPVEWRGPRRPVPDVCRPHDGDRRRRRQPKLPRIRRKFPVRQGSPRAQPDRAGRRQLRRAEGAARRGHVPQTAGDGRLGVLRVERRAVPAAGWTLGGVLRERRDAARGSRGAC